MAEQQQWEYWSGILWAEQKRKSKQNEEASPIYAPQHLIPELNALGAEGWELVHMQPVYAGDNHDVLAFASDVRLWTHAYFCVFKRPANF
ncbi:MAG: hypothetical protein HPY64_02840 [Anaerolineae bacterium]|nr:hypothetical protein [Anaerolineae bacterium]